MRINNNMMAMNTHRQLGAANAGGAKSMEKLSSGMRINRAGDDAAGLSISEKMRGQIRGLNQASANSQDGISMIQTAEGALNETHAILQRMRELAVQSSNDTNVGVDRSEIQKEMDELSKEVTRIANNTEFNTQKLTNGGIGKDGLGEVKFHIGANEGQDVALSINAMDAKSLGVARDVLTAKVNDTNTAKVSSAKVDAVDVEKILAAGDYTITVEGQAAGAITATDKDGAAVTNAAITGTATADTEITLTWTAGAGDIAAVNTGVALGNNVDFAALTDISIDTTNVTLTNTKALGASYDAKANIDDVVTALQTDIDAVAALKDKYIVGKDGDKLTITSAVKGVTNGVAVAIADGTGGDGSHTKLGLTTAAAQVAAADGDAWVASGDATGAIITGNAIDINGVKVATTIADGATAGDTITIKGSKDATQTARLSNASGNIGDAVTINKANGGTYTLGNTTTGQAKVNFKAGEAAVGSSTITVAKSEAKAAAKQADNTMSDATNAGGINVSTQDTASKAITTINDALESVSAERSKLGAMQNRLEHTIKNLDNTSENLQASEARIRDVDMAKEMMEQTKQNILAQASTAMLAQANMAPQSVLQLLG